MAESNEFASTFEDGLIQSYEVLCYIRDDNGAYVDFSDRLEINGRDLLMKIGNIQHVTELKAGGGSFFTKCGSIIMSNIPEQADGAYSLCSGFYDQPFSSTLKTIYGNTASFPLSSDLQHSVLYRHYLKLGLRAYLKDETVEDSNLGVFLIDGERMDRKAATLTLKLIGLPKALMDTDISNMKDGLGWYQNRSYPFLIQEIIKRSDLADEGAVPSGYTIPDIVHTETADQTRTLSSFGRPPEWDEKKWQEKKYTCRALEWCDTGDRTSPTTKTSEERLYLGCDEYILEYDPSTDTYSAVADLITDLSYASGTYVRKLWYNSNYTGNNERLWGVAWAAVADDSRTVTMKIFSAKVSSTNTWTITEAESIANVFPGDFSYRDGRYYPPDAPVPDFEIVGQTSDNDYNAGENISLPFSQEVIQTLDSGLLTYYEKSSAIDINATHATTELPEQLDSGYYAIIVEPDASSLIGIRFSLGQVGCVTFNVIYRYGVSASTQKGGIFYVVWDGTNYDYHIYDIHGDTSYDLELNYQINSIPVQPTCGCSKPGSYKFYIGAMCWYDSGNDNSRSYIIEMDPPRDGVAKNTDVIYSSTADSISAYRTFQEIIFNNSDDEPLHVTTYKRDKSGTATAFEFCTYDDTDVDSELVIKRTSSHQLKGLVLVTDSGGIYADTWFVAVGTGNLHQFDFSEDIMIVADQGYPIVYGDTNLSSNLVCAPQGAVDPASGISGLDGLTRTNDVIFGVSAPNYPAETQISDPDGKYYLWKYDRYVSGRVELADFEDMNGWDALKLFAEASGYLMGFDVDGNFFFVSRPSSASADFVFLCDGEYSRIDNVIQDMGYGEIYNYAKVTPYRVIKKEPEADLIAIEPPDTFTDGGKTIDRPPPPDYSVSHRDGNRKSLRLICTQDGKVGTTTDYALFKWITYQNIIETHFAEDVSVGESTEIKLGSVFGGNDDDDGIHDGDYIVVQDSTYKQDVIREVTNVNADDDEIDISATVAAGPNEFTDKDGAQLSFTIGDEVRILKRAKVDSTAAYKEWSGDGVTYVTAEVDTRNFDVENAQNLEVGTVVVLEYTSGGTFYSEQRIISAIDRSASPVRITIPAAGDAFSANPPIGTVVKAYFAVTSWDNYFPIGGTNLWVIFHEPASGDEDTKWTARMFKGDILDINCKGLVLESDDQSVKTVYDATSRSKYGKRPFTGLENKFLHHKLAKDRARKIVSDYASPKRILTVTGSLIPHLTFLKSTGALKQLAVRDRVLFPLAENNQVVGYPRAISHSPINHSTTVTFREI